MKKALMKLLIAVELLKIVIRTELLKLLGVEDRVKQAFEEGYSMALDDDFSRLQRERIPYKYSGGQAVATIYGTTDLRNVVANSRCWRSVDEAWANSDAQEMFE